MIFPTFLRYSLKTINPRWIASSASPSPQSYNFLPFLQPIAKHENRDANPLSDQPAQQTLSGYLSQQNSSLCSGGICPHIFTINPRSRSSAGSSDAGIRSNRSWDWYSSSSSESMFLPGSIGPRYCPEINMAQVEFAGTMRQISSSWRVEIVAKEGESGDLARKGLISVEGSRPTFTLQVRDPKEVVLRWVGRWGVCVTALPVGFGEGFGA